MERAADLIEFIGPGLQAMGGFASAAVLVALLVAGIQRLYRRLPWEMRKKRAAETNPRLYEILSQHIERLVAEEQAARQKLQEITRERQQLRELIETTLRPGDTSSNS